MDSCYAIEVKHVSKSFKVYLDKGRTLKEKMLFSGRRKYEERKVLKDISFEVKKGQGLGLIGHNGCGKSTMLKMLTKIMYPDSGTIEMRGRVSSLIELGAGFHPDMSGKQNIYTNASIFGLTKKEIDARLEDIIAFSELEDFIDNPVRTYSSGMYMRLAFSVAINVDAEVLLIDEILAVGDASFQAKCFNKLKEIKASGTTVVIVSHSLSQIEEICETSIWIHQGKVRECGNPKDVHEKYMLYVMDKRIEVAEKELVRQNEKREEEHKLVESVKDSVEKTLIKDIEITDVKMLDTLGNERNIFKTNDRCAVNISFKVNTERNNMLFAAGILRIDGILYHSMKMRVDGEKGYCLKEDGEVLLTIDDLTMLPGLYSMDVAIENEDASIVDYITNAYKFEVVSIIHDEGITRLKHSWKVR
ncbi:ABC transporter ATP-binding protein [Clostridium sp. E02]|uniref:ABC transporter ATP-binding protein n=1 Tax=Clostridium sp. E02 TaxID=2487134 RepID=UPI000F52D10E|nr:ABC transporter ATP-binding protein [Clostridium sp. E02]